MSVNLKIIKAKEIFGSATGIIGVFVGIWGLVLNIQIVTIIGVILILLSHLTTKMWWLRLVEKIIAGSAGVFINYTGDQINDACLAILIWSSLGAVLETIGNTMASLEDMEKSGELGETAKSLTE